ncbi:hypothetical protein M2271_001127 [Streptomyces sp. LBL]|nr:hypothetical protein [Streptomyces sp. LBL]MDH6623340.1 hypothetical protein [Streptomyces sp. LBL]
MSVDGPSDVRRALSAAVRRSVSSSSGVRTTIRHSGMLRRAPGRR